MAADPYKVLGVPPTASKKEIGKAFRQKARTTHPDKLPQNTSEAAKQNAKKLFQQLVDAYDVLSDDEKRAIYDESKAHPAHQASASRSRASDTAGRAAPQGNRARREPTQAEREAWERQEAAHTRFKEEQERKRNQKAKDAWDRREQEHMKRNSGGLGSHWVGPDPTKFMDEPGWTRSRNFGRSRDDDQDHKSDASSELSFDIGIDLKDLDLKDLELPEEDEEGEHWNLKRPAAVPADTAAAADVPLSAAGPEGGRTRKCCVVQ
eukprot:TRINITY_DN12360_c4_g1_i1.p1 TRINITY_DN12360_c4_g1~~TRINITY_DN12360_c4_g1_i1.p1  ORF type:complete len:264 (-),score=77.41 TRINITY_DN12360_c4_g1_i1:139-930(-)